jgi:germination protein M
MARRVFVWVMVLLMVVCMVPGCADNKKANTDVQTNTQPEDDTNMRRTVLYFRDASGYVVPVMKKIPNEEGIAKAALKCLIAGSDEDIKLASLGVTAPVPEGTAIDLDIAKGQATVNLKMSKKCEDKAAEEAMLTSVVNTLLEFATVDKVSVQINGQAVSKLPNGAEVKDVYDAQILNIEPAGAPNGADGKLELCFANEAGRLIVPVHRVAGEQVSLAVALTEMLEPMDETGLVSLFPPSCDVLGASVSDTGTATIEFSNEFNSISDTPAMETMALRAIGMVCKQFHGVKEYKIVAGGKAVESTVTTAASGSVPGDEFLNYYN